MDSISKVVNMQSKGVFVSQLLLPFPNNLFPGSKLSCFPLSVRLTKPPKFVRLKTASTLTCNDQESNSTFKKFQPSPWFDQLHSISVDVSEIDTLTKEMNLLKLKVKKTLMSYQGGIDSTKKKILMIYLLTSLGLAYHFKEEIYETLQEGFEKIEEMMAAEEDLYTVSTIFWVFRTHCHYISSDVFRRFKGMDGNFKETLSGDAKGILSLYEAAHLHTTTDNILDEALSFASSHLESLAADGRCPPHLLMRVRNALTLSQRWNMEMLFAVEYISSYEQEKDHDEMLLKFAKISFKLVQHQYLQDLKVLTKWYTEVNFASNLPPYFRDLIFENNFLTQAMFIEPQVSCERITYTKFFTVLGIPDGSFDRYLSLTEAESLANSLKRWAPDDAMYQQHDNLKFVFNFILDTFKEFERELRPEKTPYSVRGTMEEFKTLVEAHIVFARWAHASHVPTFDEYMKFGEVTITVYASVAALFMCLGKMGTREAYEWLKSRPKLVQSISFKGRLMNDIYGLEDDMSRGYVPNAVNCYMKQYGVTKQEAIRELFIMVGDVDKVINEEMLTTTGVSRLVLKAIMGNAQMIAIFYNGYEGFTNPEGKTKDYMTSLLIDQIHL